MRNLPRFFTMLTYSLIRSAAALCVHRYHHQFVVTRRLIPSMKIIAQKYSLPSSYPPTRFFSSRASSGEIACVGEAEAEIEGEDFEDNLAELENDDDDIWDVSPALPRRAMTFGPFANHSVVIQKLVQLGVQVYQWEGKKKVPEFILRADLQKDIAPRINFLSDIGVDSERLGYLLTKNPYLLMEDLDSLKTRLEYLRSKKFDEEMITAIVNKNPFWLSFRTELMDKRLGFFQEFFLLKGDQVRQLATKGPRLITSHLGRVKDVAFVVKERMGFEPDEIRQLLLQRPDLFYNFHQEVLWRKFDYLHNSKKISHERLLKWPELLIMKESELKSRIGFLELLGRAQFNPTKPAFVSFRDIIEMDDSKFATQVAHSSTLKYNEYLRTL